MTALFESRTAKGRPGRLASTASGYPTAAAEPRPQRNREIQGLRAFAVLSVVGDHLLQYPRGGFVGVDVFFVISGYLITGLMLREVASRGRIDLGRFYRRRIKRTLPMALVVVLATLGVGAALFPAYRLQQLQTAAASASTFWINFHLIALRTDYLHATDMPSPLQHFWSLAVEEQFYLVWPLLFIAAAAIGRRLARPRAGVGGAAAIVLLASGAWCLWQSAADPTAAYFSTASRGWEFAFGALLAVLMPALGRRIAAVTPLAPALAWTGLAALIVAVVRIGPESPFPAPWAALPVLATGAVIAGSASGSAARVFPLSNRAAVAIGELSYSIYLWHFPVIVFAGAVLPESKAVRLLELALIVGLSVVSYALIEHPLRQVSWRTLATWPFRSNRFRRCRSLLRTLPGRRVALGAMVATGALIVLPLFDTVSIAQAVPTGALRADQAAATVPAGDLAAVREAATATAWPASVRNAIDDQTQLLPTQWVRDGCLRAPDSREDPAATARRCTFGAAGAPRTAVLFGDSVSLAFYPALRAALASNEWRIVVLASEQCPAFDMSVLLGDGSPYPQCDGYRRWAMAYISRTHPDLTVTANSYLALGRWKSEPGVPDSASAWGAGAGTAVAAMGAASGRVLVLDAPETGPDLRDCLTPFAAPRQCAGTVNQSFVDAVVAERTALARLAGAGRIVHPPTFLWYCTPEGVCPSFVDGEPTLADGMHPSVLDAGRVGELIAAALRT